MAKDEAKVKNSAAKKRGFFHDIIAEAGRVNWPDLKKSKKAVASVFFVLVMFSLAIWLFDTSIQSFGRFIGFYRSVEERQVEKHPNIPLDPNQAGVTTDNNGSSSTETKKDVANSNPASSEKQDAKTDEAKKTN